MLSNSTWDNFLKDPLKGRPTSFEFYANNEFKRLFVFEPKASQLTNFESGGAQLILQSPTGPKTFHTAVLNPSALEGLMAERALPHAPIAFSRRPESLGKAWETNREIEQACRRILLESGHFTDFKATYEERMNEFLFANSNTALQKGRDGFAWFTAQFTIQKGERSKTFKIQRGRTDIPSLLNDLEKPLASKELIEKALQHPWPAPRGRVNVVWSDSALAKLLLKLIHLIEFSSRTPRSFEALSKEFPQLAFQVIDNWKQGNRIDVEGRARQETLIVDGKTLPCPFDETVPGFSRRTSSREFPITAPWEPALFGLERDDRLLSKLGNGLFVRDLEILSFQPTTGRVSFEITEATLVHQGIEGEFIEPVKLESSLLDLFHSLKLFSDTSHPHPLLWSRLGQCLFVEVSTPEALSPLFDYPGTVPISHYW